ncbi:MAG: ATP-binding protein [Saonia sp.]
MTHISPSKLYPTSVDLNNCDKEPIHIIGKIQNHGYLLASSITDKTITRCSQNAGLLLGKDPEQLLGKSITQIIDGTTIGDVIHELRNKTVVYRDITIDDQEITIIAHQSNSEYIFEFERNTIALNAFEYQLRLTEIVSEINTISNLSKMCDRAAFLIKEYLGYDRVMIYRFDADWNGKIVAERKEDHLESWLGLQYPATDIPKQARALFLKQGVRIIADVASDTVPIISAKTCSNDHPLDLSRSELRAVSPIHIEYLNNMEVNATLTAAIVCDNMLWGLIACHHYSPRYINYYQRLSCKFLTQVFATRIQLDDTDHTLDQIKTNSLVRSKLIDQIDRNNDISFGLSSFEYTLNDLTDSSGAAMCIDNSVITIGICPSKEQIIELVQAIKSLTSTNQYHTNSFSQDFEAAKHYKDIASGVMCMFISNSNDDALLWFKPEVIQTVDWAGNPEKAVSVQNDLRLSPRKSFEKWSEEQTGKAVPWKDYEISGAVGLQKNIFEIILRKYEEVRSLNDKLKKAYEDLESFSYSVSHDLRAPLRGIDGFAQIIKEEYQDSLDEFCKSSLETIISSAQKMNNLIDDILAYSGLGQQSLQFEDFSTKDAVIEVYNMLKNQYPKATMEITKELPHMYGDRSMILLLLKNLIENALKYSSKENKPLVKIGVTEKGAFFVSDNGIGFDARHQESIFGVFVRLSNSEFSGSGIGLAIAKRVVDKHQGSIWAESSMGKGSTFYFKLHEGEI